MLENALKFASINWHVFPCSNKNKQPLTKNGFHVATTDEKTIREWWTKWPNAMIGVACGKSGIVVIDIDIKDNRNGALTWESIKTENIVSVEQKTQSGGRQIILKASPNQSLKQGADVNGYHGIDIRNKGGYIIVAPSVMLSKNKYEWLVDQSPFDMDPVETPDWVVTLFGDEGKRTRFEIPAKTKAGSRDTTVFKMACSLKSRNDMPFDQVLAAVRAYNQTQCDPPLDDSIVIKKVESAFSYKDIPLEMVEGLEELYDDKPSQLEYSTVDDIQRLNSKDVKWDYVKTKKNEEKKLATSFRNMLNILRVSQDLYNIYRFNEFSKDIDIVKYHKWMNKSVYPGKTVDDEDIMDLKGYLSDKYGFQPSTTTIHEAVTTNALKHSYNPVKMYLKALKWDGVERLGSWLVDYCGAEDSAYTRTVGWLTLVAACARIDRPGCKYDYMTIFEGDQGIGKSQAVSILGGEWGGEVNLMAKDKDTVDKMRGKWIIEVPEMVAFKKQEIEALKQFISYPKDRVRTAYARRSKDFPRQCIFICTLNPSVSGYLIDDTGNRRFWPVLMSQIDLPCLRRDKDQLFAEAWIQAKSPQGRNLYIKDKNVEEEAKKHQKQRQQQDEMMFEVEKWLNQNSFQEYTRGADIFISVFKKDIGDFGIREQRRIGQIMKELGWIKSVVRDKEAGKLVKVYKKLEQEQGSTPWSE